MVDEGSPRTRCRPLQREVTNKLGDIYRQRMDWGGLRHSRLRLPHAAVLGTAVGRDGRLLVRHRHGRERLEALTVWFERTDKGTRRLRFAEIDYVRIFPGETRKMVWDGSPGAEMFRGGEEEEDDDE